MADELARINLLTDTKATIEASTEDGTPGIATDYGHRLGWLSGGSFRWAALTGTDESFASVKVANIPAGKVPTTDATGKLVQGSISDDGTTATLAGNVVISNIGLGKIPYVNQATGYLADSSLSEDAKSVKSAKPLTLNGATRPAWGAGWRMTMLGGTVSIGEKAFGNGSYLFLMRNTYTDGTVFKAITQGASGVNFPALASISDNGILSFQCSQTSPAAADAVVTDLVTRWSVNRFGGAGFFGVTPPTSRPTVNAAATDLATVIALTNQLRTHLIACGLVQ